MYLTFDPTPTGDRVPTVSHRVRDTVNWMVKGSNTCPCPTVSRPPLKGRRGRTRSTRQLMQVRTHFDANRESSVSRVL